MEALLIIRLIVFYQMVTSLILDVDYNSLRDTGNYSCEELKFWFGTEKHYSSKKRESLFKLLDGEKLTKCEDIKFPFFLPKVVYKNVKGIGMFSGKFVHSNQPNIKSQRPCKSKDNIAVIFLSNYSMNRNYSHFLHALLRMFCALIDSNMIVWNIKEVRFISKIPYIIWLDQYLKLTPNKMLWIDVLSYGGSNTIRKLGTEVNRGECMSAEKLVYGSGCVKLLPPEKWHGYPGCRSKHMLSAFRLYFRQIFNISNDDFELGVPTIYLNNTSMKDQDQYTSVKSVDYKKLKLNKVRYKIKTTFLLRPWNAEQITGMRSIRNLGQVQTAIAQDEFLSNILYMNNITFRDSNRFSPAAVVQTMSDIDIFISIHEAGLTNMFFMRPGTAVIEIIPHNLCSCRSSDYFYGDGGYYHGTALALNIKHYSFCVSDQDTTRHGNLPISKDAENVKCSWKTLHDIQSVRLETLTFISLLRKVIRELVASGSVKIRSPIIKLNPHING